MQSMTIWSFTIHSTTSRKPNAASGIAKKSFLPCGRSCFAVARHIIEECYNLEKMMSSLGNYFDYEAFARELFMYDYQMGANNNVFRVL